MTMFVDTSGWAAFFDNSQTQHVRARRIMRKSWKTPRPVITTNFVLAELTALLNHPLRIPRPLQIQYLSTIRSHANVTVAPVDPVVESAAWNLWESRLDKEWSLVDCASFVVMQREQLTEALTGDHHFAQAGFVRLLK